MSVRYGKLGLAALSLAVLGTMAMPLRAHAQDTPPATPGAGDTNDQNKVISLDLEATDLYYALTLLFKQAKANYTLDPNLRGNLVTVHIKQPFKQALETVLKASGLPYTYAFENGVYSVVPIKEDKPGTDIPVPTDDGKGGPETTAAGDDIPVKLFVTNLNGLDIVAALGGKAALYTSNYNGNVGYNPFSGGQGGQGGGLGGNSGFGGGSGGFGGGGFGGGSGGFGGGGFGGGSGGFGGGGFGGGSTGGFGGGGFGGGGRGFGYNG